MNIYILGGSSTKFGELWDISPRKLMGITVRDTLKQANIERKQIQAVFVGNMLSGILGGQEHLGAFFAEELGLVKPSMKIESACSSGGMAVHNGFLAVKSGLYDTVLVVGVEKMTDYRPEKVAKALMGAGSEAEREAGATFPALYAMLARAHMEKYGTTEEDLARIAVKNHYHASLNSLAQFPFQITIEQVIKSPVIASPLKLLDCSPISDGAASLIISKKAKNKASKCVKIVASAIASDTLGLAQRKDLTGLQSSVYASQKAYQMSAIGPKDIDLAEVHDCFTIAEIMALEDLGFYKRGETAPAIQAGRTKLGGEQVINTSGGLKASGHPVGATGVKQIVEIYHQLKGIAGKRQVSQAKVGLAHNVGGSGATAVVHILKK